MVKTAKFDYELTNVFENFKNEQRQKQFCRPHSYSWYKKCFETWVKWWPINKTFCSYNAILRSKCICNRIVCCRIIYCHSMKNCRLSRKRQLQASHASLLFQLTNQTCLTLPYFTTVNGFSSITSNKTCRPVKKGCTSSIRVRKHLR